MEAEWKELEAEQGEDGLSTAVLQEPPTHRASLPNHPFQAIRAGLQPWHPENPCEAALGCWEHGSHGKRYARCRGGKGSPGRAPLHDWRALAACELQFQSKGSAYALCRDQKSTPCIVQLKWSQSGQNHEWIEPLHELQAAPLPNAA